MAKKLQDAVEFYKLEKITDEVYSLGLNTVLKFNVSLARNISNKRQGYHKEFEYSSKASDVGSLVTIRRNFDYYLSIENVVKDMNGNKLFIRIGPQEYFLFKRGLEQAISWFEDKKYSKLFALDNKKGIIMMPPIPDFTIRGLPMNKTIELSPIVIEKGFATDEKKTGVRMVFPENKDMYLDINIDKFMGLYYLISNFNMYQAAISLVNYIGRPEFGTNRVVLDSNGSHNNIIEDDEKQNRSTGIIGRTVSSKINITDLEG